MNPTIPNYKKIYSDMIHRKYPEKVEDLERFLQKEVLSPLDVIGLNKKLKTNADRGDRKFNQRLRSYNKDTILEILEYQKVFRLNNSQLADHFSLSRNTVTSWKKRFFNMNNNEPLNIK